MSIEAKLRKAIEVRAEGTLQDVVRGKILCNQWIIPEGDAYETIPIIIDPSKREVNEMPKLQYKIKACDINPLTGEIMLLGSASRDRDLCKKESVIIRYSDNRIYESHRSLDKRIEKASYSPDGKYYTFIEKQIDKYHPDKGRLVVRDMQDKERFNMPAEGYRRSPSGEKIVGWYVNHLFMLQQEDVNELWFPPLRKERICKINWRHEYALQIMTKETSGKVNTYDYDLKGQRYETDDSSYEERIWAPDGRLKIKTSEDLQGIYLDIDRCYEAHPLAANYNICWDPDSRFICYRNNIDVFSIFDKRWGEVHEYHFKRATDPVSWR